MWNISYNNYNLRGVRLSVINNICVEHIKYNRYNLRGDKLSVNKMSAVVDVEDAQANKK